MRKLFKNVGIVAMEAADDAATAAAAPAADENNAESAETDLIDVAEGDAEQETSEAAVDEATEVAAALESFKTALEAACATGGLDKNGATVMNIGLEHLYARMGFPAGERLVSLESYGQASSRERSTQIALETVKEKLAQIWASIIAHIKKAIQWLADHYNKVFGAAEKLQKRGKAISDKAKGVNGQKKETKFDNERIAKALSVNGSVPATPSTELVKIKAVADKVYNMVVDFNAKAAEELLTDLAKADGKVADVKATAFAGGVIAPIANPESLGFAKPNDGLDMFRGPAMMGNKAILSEATKTDVTGDAAVVALSKSTYSLGAFDPKAAEIKNFSVATLEPAEAGKIGDEVEALCGEVIKFRAKQSKSNELKKKIIAAAEKAGKDSTTEEDKEKAAFYGAMQKIATNATANLDRAPASMSSYILNTCKNACDYAEQSLKQYAAK